MDDYLILSLAKEERELAENLLYNKYYQLLYKYSLKYCHNNIYIEDYLNEARYILIKSIDSYKDNNKYLTYLTKCLNNGLLNYYNHEVCNKFKFLNEKIDLEDDILYNFQNIVNNNPEDMIMAEDNYIYLTNKIKNKLSWKEELVFDLKRQYYNNKEISLITGYKLRTVYNIIDRIKKVMSKIMSS